MFLHRYCSFLSKGWKDVFPQQRTTKRAIEQAVATPCCMGRRTISRTICALDRHQQDWSADYKLFSRSKWDEERLFRPVFKTYLEHYPTGPIAVGFDDTKIPKSGRKIETVFRQRDPMSPPFHVNLILAQRFIQGSLLFPHYQEGNHDARGVPIRFREAPALKKPPKRATEEEKKAFLQARRRHNLSTQTLSVMADVRNELDLAGAGERKMLSVVDGSFCNRTIFHAKLPRMELVARCRKDAKLCLSADPDQRRKYAVAKFTPEQVRQNDEIPWKTVLIRYGGKKRLIRYKEVGFVLWQRGAGKRKLRLFVIAPQPYKLSPNANRNYRQPAYLLTTDETSTPTVLLQAYFDRWQIEVNHRDEKSILGVGHAQVHSPMSAYRHPTFVVASYSMMLLAAMQEFGPNRTDDFIPLPKWRKKANRPSALDLVSLLRKQINETHFSTYMNDNFSKNLALYAYT